MCLLLVCLSSYKCDDSFSGKHCIRCSRIRKDLSVWLTEELRLAKLNVIMHLVQLSVRGHCPPVQWCNDVPVQYSALVDLDTGIDSLVHWFTGGLVHCSALVDQRRAVV